MQYVRAYVGLAVTRLVHDEEMGGQLKIMCMNVVCTPPGPISIFYSLTCIFFHCNTGGHQVIAGLYYNSLLVLQTLNDVSAGGWSWVPKKKAKKYD
jgi:hypothetical protein